MTLSARACKQLRDIADRLITRAQVEKRRTKGVEEIVAWCQAYDIELGSRLSHDRLRFDAELLVRIDDTLAALGQPAIRVDLGGLTSAEQARHGNREEKAVRESPRARRVLVSLPAGNPRPGIAAQGRDILDLDWRDIRLTAFDVVVQVENLDGFYAFDPRLPTLARWPRPLLLYRGDAHYGGAFARLAEAWAESGKPHLYLGDFDAKGVSLALASHASHLLLPPLAWLAERANPDHLPPEQQAYQPALRANAAQLAPGHPLADYLDILLREQRGLRQQWFGPSEALECVPLGRWREV